MIGNDVVDLELARRQSNWRRKGFLRKIFTEAEQEAIASAKDPETCIWLMWSMKEAAYKIHNRETGIRAYIPHKLACTIHFFSDGIANGTVNCEGKAYLTRSVVGDGLIHTIAVCPGDEMRPIAFVKDDLILKDNKGLPYILSRSGDAIPASRSHHGRFEVAVGFDVNKKAGQPVGHPALKSMFLP